MVPRLFPGETGVHPVKDTFYLDRYRKRRKALAYVREVNGGYQSVPTIVFPDGSILVEPGNAELEKKLAGIK